MDKNAGILIVDDDVNMRDTLSDILEEKGYHVAVVRDGPRAIEEVKGQHFDLALIDIVMPGMNGVEALREIRKADPKITTMIMTGRSDVEGLVSEAQRAGVNGVLYKPFEIDTIVDMITRRTEGPSAGVVDLKRYEVEPEALRLVPEAIARKYDVMPLHIEGDSLVVAMAYPENLYTLEDLRICTGMPIKPLRAALMDIRGAINLHYGAMDEIREQIKAITPSALPAEELERAITADIIAETPIVKTINLLVAQGVKDRVSDIHIEPQQDHLRIRNRIDGILHDTLSLPMSVHGPLVSRVKVMADMNIAERRRPQDGHFSMSVNGRQIDVRVGTANTTWGEMAVLRILDKSISVKDLPELGFLPESLEVYRNLIRSPYGMILVSGPTGSGKTTTLYATINQLDAEERNIVTLEDPVEYRFANINQMQVNPKAGITFASGLPAIMRLDPDVILVGEIRDPETAKTAIQAALTGHLVLSTVHANDTVGVLYRLMDLGVEPFLISSAVVSIVAQRLVRRVCPHCRVLCEAPEEERLAYEKEMGEKRTKFHYGEGCNFCANTGYRGRMGVFEILLMSEEIRRLLLKGANADTIKAQAIKEGMVPMWRDGMLKVKEGLITPYEVMRNVFVIG
ncbi:MAG: ATPase, T2SS/T4P/T4SS family [Chloroflexota bacterium]|nr:ATPase, T2SS/T4P/T4SS family [Chloroflexota bacterium]